VFAWGEIDNSRRLHRGRDIDFLGPYDAFSAPMTRNESRLILLLSQDFFSELSQDCDADETPEEGKIYFWN
jgi:hypothetical protein